jgi:hypothetical protein
MSYPKFFFSQNLHFGPIRWVPRRFLKILIIYSQKFAFLFGIFVYFSKIIACVCWAYTETILSHAEHTRNRFHRTLNIRGTDFIAHWTYEERISAHAQPAVKCEQFLHVQSMLSITEQILSRTENTRNEFHRMLSIRGTDFIACWACAEMFKSQISRLNQKRFSKILCYRPLGPYGFVFCKKSQQKISCLCTFKGAQV